MHFTLVIDDLTIGAGLSQEQLFGNGVSVRKRGQCANLDKHPPPLRFLDPGGGRANFFSVKVADGFF